MIGITRDGGQYCLGLRDGSRVTRALTSTTCTLQTVPLCIAVGSQETQSVPVHLHGTANTIFYEHLTRIHT